MGNILACTHRGRPVARDTPLCHEVTRSNLRPVGRARRGGVLRPIRCQGGELQALPRKEPAFEAICSLAFFGGASCDDRGCMLLSYPKQEYRNGPSFARCTECSSQP
jgi:hypothetical protein